MPGLIALWRLLGRLSLLPPQGASWNELPQGILGGLQKEFGVPSRLWGTPELPLLCSLSLGIGPKCPLAFPNPPGVKVQVPRAP